MRKTELTLKTVLVRSSWVDFYQTTRLTSQSDSTLNSFILSLKYRKDVNALLRTEIVTMCWLL